MIITIKIVRSASFVVIMLLLLILFNPTLSKAESSEPTHLPIMHVLLIGDGIRIHQKPNEKTRVLYKLQWGDEVSIKKFRNGWAFIRFVYRVVDDKEHAIEGWIHTRYASTCSVKADTPRYYIDLQSPISKTCPEPDEEFKNGFRKFYFSFAEAFRKNDMIFIAMHMERKVIVEDAYYDADKGAEQNVKSIAWQRFTKVRIGKYPLVDDRDKDSQACSSCKEALPWIEKQGGEIHEECWLNCTVMYYRNCVEITIWHSTAFGETWLFINRNGIWKLKRMLGVTTP